jgi:hypothetical protein
MSVGNLFATPLKIMKFKFENQEACDLNLSCHFFPPKLL